MTSALRNTLILPLKQIHDALEPLQQIRDDLHSLVTTGQAANLNSCSESSFSLWTLPTLMYTQGVVYMKRNKGNSYHKCLKRLTSCMPCSILSRITCQSKSFLKVREICNAVMIHPTQWNITNRCIKKSLKSIVWNRHNKILLQKNSGEHTIF